VTTTAEARRLAEADAGTEDWRAWGPYLAERAWGTVREDYSADGDAWAYFPHEHARSRAYRWNEDGMAGFCDEGQDWCLALALWNGTDPFLKERMFGLTGPQGNHGEDVKEYWWYLDATPTHSWNTWRYHYPQRVFPYEDLVATNAARGKLDPEYELVDTGVFADNRYWVVTVDYAKAAAHDLCLQVTVENAGPQAASLDVLPTLWFRNRWSYGRRPEAPEPRPSIRYVADRFVAQSSRSGRLTLLGDGRPTPLTCDNETNEPLVFAAAEATPYPKDGINDHVVTGAATVNPELTGTKAALRYHLTLQPGESQTIRVRLAATPGSGAAEVDVGAGFDAVVAARRQEADEFYAELRRDRRVDDAEALVLRQALAGLLWSKVFYHYDVAPWLDGDPGEPPPPPGRGAIRNGDWRHLLSHDVILMPDAWEYPWFASWDWAFHCVTLAHVDPEFAKAQLVLLLREWYLHPKGAMPAYEWNFSDVNPPVHAWAALKVFELDGSTDFTFLARVFHKLVINFTWWVNAKDAGDNNVFEGGFLGLDNIAPLNRSTLPATVGVLEQADATAWMAAYALDLLDMAGRLCRHDLAYEDVATKFFEHFLAISAAANSAGLWHDDDGFFYDVLHLVDGGDVPLRVKSLVGLIPVTATMDFDDIALDRLSDFSARAEWYLENHPALAGFVQSRKDPAGVRRLLALVAPDRLRRLLASAFDESGLLSPYGVRSVSAWHREHPFTIEVGGVTASVDYEPGESTSGLFGGNSNWRGPVWLPLNTLLVESLRRYDAQLGEAFRVEYPTGSGHQHRLAEAADDLVDRLVSIFLPGPDGRRPAHGPSDLLATDPRWRDNVSFYEYFHGDTAAGLGASHQTGWTALVAHLLLSR